MIEIVAAFRFGKDSAGNDCLRHGWGDPEDGFVWALGAESTLELSLEQAPGRMFLELSVEPFVRPPTLPAQRLDIAVNGVVLARRRLAWFATLRMELPNAVLRQGKILIRLLHPEAAAPAALGSDTDKRELAVKLRGLTLLRVGPRDEPPARTGPMSVVADYRFGGNEPTEQLLQDGWGAPEIDYVWAIGPRSTLQLPIEQPDASHVVIMDLQPFTAESAVSRQRVAIGIDGRLLEFVALDGRKCLAYALPAPQAGRQDVTISFDNLDATAPGVTGSGLDDRPLAFMLCGLRVLRGALPEPVKPVTLAALPGRIEDGSLLHAVMQATGQPPRDIMAGFEPMGNACEFSHLQRRLGWDPSGLLRFTGILTTKLVDGIIDGFWGLGRADQLDIAPGGDGNPVYFLREGQYLMTLQTTISRDLMPPSAVRRQLARVLPLLTRKFFEDAVCADKIFVLQRRDGVTRAEAEAVLAALAVWGAVVLLWVTVDDELAGCTERLGARLLHGYVCDRAGPRGLEGEWDSWLSMLANAWLLAKVRS